MGLFQGYPDQVFFAVDMVHSSGIKYTKDHSAEIIEFNKNRASIVLRQYVDDHDSLDRILEKAGQLDRRVEQDVRYHLCLSLARLKQERFLAEVQKIDGSEHDFLLGFYYRRQGRYKDAEERLKKALMVRRSERRARRELVTTYLLMDEWEKAISLARENYSQFPGNPFLVQAYFNCLIQLPKSEANRAEIEGLLKRLDSIGSDKAKEMLASATAQYLAYYLGDEEGAMRVIDDAIATYPSNQYPALTKMDICVRLSNVGELRKCVSLLKDKIDRKSGFFNALKKSEAIYYSLTGDRERALRIVEKDMRDYSEKNKQRLIDRINAV